MSTKVADILNRPVEDFQPPVPLPPGLYRAVYTKWDKVEMGQNKIPALELTFKLTEPVDPDLDLMGAELPTSGRFRIWFRQSKEDGPYDKIDWKINKVIKAMEGDTTVGVAENLENLLGADVIVEVSQTPDRNDPEVVYWNIERILPAD